MPVQPRDPGSPAGVEVHATLTGGHLKWPVVPVVKEVDGKQWVRIAKEDRPILLFLTGSCKWRRPLKDVDVLDNLVKLRNSATKYAAYAIEEDGGVDELALDTQEPALTKRRRKSSQQLAPREEDAECMWVDLKYHLPSGDIWNVRALRGDGKDHLFLELSATNMQTLFEQVSVELNFLDLLQEDVSTDLSTTGASSSESTSPSSDTSVKTTHRHSLRFLASRNVWDLRYFDSEGHSRCKTFKIAKNLDPAEHEIAKEDARSTAMRYLDIQLAK